MRMIDTQQVRKIYAIGNAIGIVDRAEGKDNLHLLIESMTNKDSVKALTYSEAAEVIRELQKRQGPPPPTKRKRPQLQTASGGATEGQKSKVWVLMYQLQEFDTTPTTATLGDRLCGIIKKELHIDATPQKPFAWIGTADCNTLIEILKKYVRSAAKNAGDGNGTG